LRLYPCKLGNEPAFRRGARWLQFFKRQIPRKALFSTSLQIIARSWFGGAGQIVIRAFNRAEYPLGLLAAPTR
jgi:hypothetical protein